MRNRFSILGAQSVGQASNKSNFSKQCTPQIAPKLCSHEDLDLTLDDETENGPNEKADHSVSSNNRFKASFSTDSVTSGSKG